MKRTKFIALALVVAVMLMGAAYASWTDSFNINTSEHLLLGPIEDPFKHS